MTLTDKQYAEAIAAVKRGTYSGIIYIDRRCDGCDGSTACAVQAKSGRRHKDELAWCSAGPHGHWRRGYNVDAGEVMRRLLDENERLRAALQDLRSLLLPHDNADVTGVYLRLQPRSETPSIRKDPVNIDVTDMLKKQLDRAVGALPTKKEKP